MSTNFEHMSDIELAEAETLLRQARERADQRKAESKSTYEPTELGNAKRFTGKFLGEMLFVPDRQQWFYWDDRLWTVDVNGYALRQFEKVIDDVKAEMGESAAALTAVSADSDAAKTIRDELKELGSWYRSSQRINIMRNSLALAAVQPDMSAPLKEFDKKGHFFGCANGIVDLRDRSLITGDKRYLMTKASPVAYRADANCPEWDKFLFTIMNGKEENVAFLQRLVGQAMLGIQGKDKLAILWGSGANGKSTLVDTLNEVFGQYGTVTDPRVLMDNNRANREYYLAPLKGGALSSDERDEAWGHDRRVDRENAC